MPLIQLTNPNAKSIEQCIREAYESFGVPPLGGASTDGWSKLADYQRCPYRYWLLYEQPPNVSFLTDEKNGVEVPAALELGALFHSMLAMHYSQNAKSMLFSPTESMLFSDTKSMLFPTPYALAERVAALGGNLAIVDEAKRLYGAYFGQYGNPQDEGITSLAVELGAGIEGIHTCRYDLLAERKDAGVWIIEHKTASSETRQVLEGWWLDGEILGEVYAYKLSGLDKVYGPLVGVCVNITFKTKVPKFRRVEVVVTDDLVEAYARDIAWWKGSRSACKSTGQWPRKLQGCISRYDTCTFFDHCRNADATDSERLQRMLELSLKR